MTASEARSIRKARKAVIRAERDAQLADFRERKRRRAVAHQGLAAPVSSEPTYEATRGAKFTCWCEPGAHPFMSESFQAEVCEGHKGE